MPFPLDGFLMKRYSLCLLFLLNILILGIFVGCADSGNTVIEQPEQPVTEEFQAEENAAISQPSSN